MLDELRHLTSGVLLSQVKEDDANDLKRGTRVTLHLKQDARELAEGQKLGSLIKQYSEFIQFPIKLWASKTEYDQVRLKAPVSLIMPSNSFNCFKKSAVRARQKFYRQGKCQDHT